MSEYPKWITPHESHDLNALEKTHEVHRDRVVAPTVLVHDAEMEAKLSEPHEAPAPEEALIDQPHDTDEV